MPETSQNFEQADAQLDDTRFDFAMKVHSGQCVTEEDMFDYLKAWTTMEIERSAERPKANSSPMKQRLLKACTERQSTPELYNYLLSKIKKARDHIRVAGDMATEDTNLLLSGMERQETTKLHKAVGNVKDYYIHEAGWVPYELQGLEQCLEFFKKNQTSNFPS